MYNTHIKSFISTLEADGWKENPSFPKTENLPEKQEYKIFFRFEKDYHTLIVIEHYRLAHTWETGFTSIISLEIILTESVYLPHKGHFYECVGTMIWEEYLKVDKLIDLAKEGLFKMQKHLKEEKQKQFPDEKTEIPIEPTTCPKIDRGIS